MVLGDAWRFRMEMIEGFGFMGIPVALLGRGSPLGVAMSALLFASLHHGSAALDIESGKIGRDLALVIQAFVILAVVTVSAVRISIGNRIFAQQWLNGNMLAKIGVFARRVRSGGKTKNVHT